MELIYFLFAMAILLLIIIIYNVSPLQFCQAETKKQELQFSLFLLLFSAQRFARGSYRLF